MGQVMLLSMVKISPVPGKRQEILDILQSVRGPTLAAPGCLRSSILEEHDDELFIVYLEEWQTRTEMAVHIRSPLYSRVLKAMELSRQQPEICFYEVSGIEGLELIESVRSPVLNP
jgi:quinol monooxygenase YgiN